MDLSRNNFHGELPEGLSHLGRLKVLNLTINNLSGKVPSWLSSFQNLQYLSHANNSFTGVIPPAICNVSTLKSLSLSFNSLSGKLPIEIGNLQSLKKLSIEYNYLSGSVPSKIFNISSLEIISFLSNSLSGSLPADMCSPPRRIKWLNLSDNKLGGQIPSTWFHCSQLQMLSLSINQFIGTIPNEIGNLTALEELYLGVNNFRATIPEQFCNLHRLKQLWIEEASLTGSIPAQLFNISTLLVVVLNDNILSGNLPLSNRQRLPNLEVLSARGNKLHGVIPASISNASNLYYLNLARNKFSGPIADSLGDLRLLEHLNLGQNYFTCEPSILELSFISSLTKCKYLEFLGMNDNSFNGSIPKSIGNLSHSIEKIFASESELMGSIPDWFGYLSNLLLLSLYGNHLTGSVPYTFKSLQKLQALNLENNLLSGPPPHHFCDMSSLYIVTMGQNQISGAIPSCLGNVTSLGYLLIDQNLLNSSIPANLWNLSHLLKLDLSSNSLSGSLPEEMQNLKAATSLNLSANDISGNSPSSIAGLQNLLNLSLAQNKIEGSIPNSVGNMLSLQYLDLSHNDLSGVIPKFMEALSYLSYINLSFNNLSGEIPSGGPFKNFTSQSFMSNAALCGAPRYRRKNNVPTAVSWKPLGKAERFSYYELLRATNGYNESNLPGTGSFGSVYRGTQIDGTQVAVKVFKLQLEGTHDSFVSECETTPVVHCDIKPSNILLDEGMVAHVSDFGLSKLLSQEDSNLHTKTLATLGYIAPEYGAGGLVSTRSDVYSFGIVLIETFSRMKPSDQIFVGDLSLKSWIEDSLHTRTTQTIDANLLSPEDEYLSEKLGSIYLTLELALSCCNERPRDRTSMNHVVVSLEKIKHQLVSVCGEESYKHLKEFTVVCSNMKPPGVIEEQIKMWAFPLSLKGVAKDWLYYLPFGTREDIPTRCVNEVNILSLQEQLTKLTSMVRKMAVGNVQQFKACRICKDASHPTNGCSMLQDDDAEQVNITGNMRVPRRQYDSYSNMYNLAEYFAVPTKDGCEYTKYRKSDESDRLYNKLPGVSRERKIFFSDGGKSEEH
ncbi:receptor kinase-like protein Xa21 [Coffea eugenioides]|uniref:receptor kinase-like protein Xa21 n=1 Tax=Coffea eugenioides TaxID=49369 RepID=UPI000F610173|nr:receptor kinase-like protein Xa21 [Coffea eugenioides]